MSELNMPRENEPIFTEDFQRKLDNLKNESHKIWGDTLTRIKSIELAPKLPTGWDCDHPHRFAAYVQPVDLQRSTLQRDQETALLYLAAATGILGSKVEITRATRAIMDDDKAFLQTFLKHFFESNQEISAWIDHVPGGAIAGGWAHRLSHGHDLQAMLELWKQHGHVGGLEWVNHVLLRDFWTPHGVPYLPAGAGTVYDWLLVNGVAPADALSLLSINVAEAATGVLAVASLLRMSDAVLKELQRRRLERAMVEMIDLSRKGCSEQALESAGQLMLLGMADKNPAAGLKFASTCLDLSRAAACSSEAHQWGSKAFMAAAGLVQAGPRIPKLAPYHGGTVVDFAGLAATIMIAAYASHLRVANISERNVINAARFGAQRCIDLADEQRRPNRVKFRQKSWWGYRPLSALTNLRLALEICTACGSLFRPSHDPIAIRNMMSLITRDLRNDDRYAALAGSIETNLRCAYPYRNAASIAAS
jgi:hypothetical protein